MSVDVYKQIETLKNKKKNNKVIKLKKKKQRIKVIHTSE